MMVIFLSRFKSHGLAHLTLCNSYRYMNHHMRFCEQSKLLQKVKVEKHWSTVQLEP